jgi:glycosyltransferase involved in cell wall biosynthesis
MKILFVDTQCHRKNKIGFELLCKYNNIESVISKEKNTYSGEYDLVIIPSEYIAPESFPKAKYILYGPHNFVFATGIWKGPAQQFPSYCFYNTLSPWVDTLQKEFGGLSLQSRCIPFPVDVYRFCPSVEEKKYDCFFYFKGRRHELISFVKEKLTSLGLTYKFIRYGSYTEEEYLETLRSSRFGVWVGCHESQGFALEEALSVGVPLAVWNVKSMFDEYNHENQQSYKENPKVYKLTATSAPYWDGRCGEIFHEVEEFDETVLKVANHIDKYSPREYILETLSPEACYKRLLQTLEIIPSAY